MMDATGEEVVKNGDLSMDDATQQLLQGNVVTMPGENSFAPEHGFGIDMFLLDEVDPIEIKKGITAAAEADGARLDSLKMEGLNEIFVQGKYVS